jgi:hypothetical protein
VSCLNFFFPPVNLSSNRKWICNVRFHIGGWMEISFWARRLVSALLPLFPICALIIRPVLLALEPCSSDLKRFARDYLLQRTMPRLSYIFGD